MFLYLYIICNRHGQFHVYVTTLRRPLVLPRRNMAPLKLATGEIITDETKADEKMI